MRKEAGVVTSDERRRGTDDGCGRRRSEQGGKYTCRIKKDERSKDEYGRGKEHVRQKKDA